MTVSATGLIAWTIPSAGVFQVTVSVTNGRGGSATQRYVLTVTPASLIVPNVDGLTQSAATAALISANLTVGTVTQQTSATVPAGYIISQAPAAGTLVAQGTPVSLIVSQPTGLPPDPSTVASPVATTVATKIGEGTAFLYTGPNPIQTGVAPMLQLFESERFLFDHVIPRDREALAQGRGTFLNHLLLWTVGCPLRVSSLHREL
jgi:PASTA domain